MNDLLTLILKNITTHPEDVSISESTDGDKKVFTIKVHDEDMGRVIGKDGKVIRAIRSIAHVAGIRASEHYLIRLEDGEAPADRKPVTSNTETAPDETEEATNTEVEPAQSVEVEPEADTADDLIAGSIEMNSKDSKEE